MAIQSTPYDLANLQQTTQAGGAFLDYLKNQRDQEDQARNAQQRLQSALALQQAENAGGVQRVEAAGKLAAVQGDLNRQNALALVGAQEHARIAAQKQAIVSRLQARYPRKPDESDDDYTERVGKEQADAPNRLYKQILLKQSTAQTTMQKLQDRMQKEISDAEAKRQPKVEALARTDLDLIAAFKDVGIKTVPADVAGAIQKLRSIQGKAEKAAALDDAWSAALTKANDPKHVPYPIDLGTKIDAFKREIQNTEIASTKQQEQLQKGYDLLVKDLIRPEYLDFLPDTATPAPSTPFGPPASAAPPRIPGNTDRTPLVDEFMGGPPAPPAPADVAPAPPLEGAIPDALRAGGNALNQAVVQPLAGLNSDIAGAAQELAPSRSDVAPFLSEIRKAATESGNTMGAIRRNLIRRPGETAPPLPDPLTAYLSPIQTGLNLAGAGMQAVANPVSETLQGLASYVQPAAWNNDPSALDYPKVYKIRKLFGADALQLLAQAKEIGKQRGIPDRETQATFDRAVAGDATSIQHVRNFFDMLRAGPIQDEPMGPPIDSTIRDDSMGPPITPVTAPYAR